MALNQVPSDFCPLWLQQRITQHRDTETYHDTLPRRILREQVKQHKREFLNPLPSPAGKYKDLTSWNKGYLQLTTENMEGNCLQRLNILKNNHILI